MSTVKLFSLYDSKRAAFTFPYESLTTAEALRNFKSAYMDKQSLVHIYPEDYFLYELGEFDKNAAAFHLLSAPLNLGPASQFVDTTVSMNVVNQDK